MGFRKIEFSKADRPERVSPGSAPILQWLDIDSLVIDENYQRDLKRANWSAIRRIAKQFHWSRFSPVFVAPIEGGLYAIIDGQHRTHAAAICGFSQVPCQIVQMSTEEQAAAFAAVNGVVTKVTSVQLLKAGLAAGEEWAVVACRIAEEADCRLMTYNKSGDSKKPGEIFGVNGFLKVVAARPHAAIVSSLKMMMSAEGYNDNQDIWDAHHLMHLLMALSERPLALANPGFRRAFEDFDYWELDERDRLARRSAARVGGKFPPRSESMRMEIVSWIDRTFPARIALPAPDGMVA
tara:strand:- start:36121 stop:37002 length:882 start_codon:yes stop_codon:yes gene_type:complete